MQDSKTDGHGNPQPDQSKGINPNTSVMIRTGLSMTICFFMATTMPPALMLASLQSLLFFGMFIFCGMAMLAGERMTAPHATRWDAAALHLFVSMLCGLFVDPQAILDTLQALPQAQPATPA